jgi:WD40 repeat protein
LVALHEEGQISLWDLLTGVQVGILSGFQGKASRFVFSAEQPPRVAVLADVLADKKWWFGAVTGAPPLRMMGEAVRAGAIALTADGQRLALGTADGEVSLWDTASGQRQRQWKAHAFRLRSLTFSPDGRTLATTAQESSGATLWDVASGRPVHPEPGHRGRIRELKFLPDGRLISTAWDQELLRWDLATGRAEHLLTLPGNWWARGVAIAPDGRTVATVGRGVAEGVRATLWDVQQGRELRRLGQPGGLADLYDGFPVPVVFAPDGATVVTIRDDNELAITSAATGEDRHLLHGLDAHTYALAISPDSRLLATGGGKVVLWDLATGQRMAQGEVKEMVTALAFHPGGRLLAVTEPQRATLWDVASGRSRAMPTGVAPGWRGHLNALAFSPDGRYLAAAALSVPDGLYLWEVASGQKARVFEGPLAGQGALTFSRDGRTLVSGGSDSTILIWDLTGRRKRPAPPLGAEPLESQWAALGGRADQASAAVWELAARPAEAVALLGTRIAPSAKPTDKELAQLIADLGHEAFARREAALAGLRELGEVAGPALRKALADQPKPEQRQRIEQLLAGLDTADRLAERTGEALRHTRAVQVLEYATTAEARALLRRWAGGGPGTPLTVEAQAALARLDHPRE